LKFGSNGAKGSLRTVALWRIREGDLSNHTASAGFFLRPLPYFRSSGATESAKEGEGRRKPLTPMRGTYYKAWAMSDWVKG
jgi:hypothetical protein